MEFIDFLKTLTPADWETKVTDKWTVKDIVAHMVGWEREGAKTFLEAWQKGEKPWFMTEKSFDDFNNRIIEEYIKYSPEELMNEWKKWQDDLDRQVKEIGEDKVNERYREFDWVFDSGDDNHYEHHLKQIKAGLNK